MAWTMKQIVLALVMVGTGSINTLSSSWADNTSAVGSDGVNRLFNHPFFQAVCMFLGETFCLWTYFCLYCYKYKETKKIVERNPHSDLALKAQRPFLRKPPYNPLIFLLPAFCDMCATSIMYIGLTMTYPSSYQMLRGSLIIFTGLLSVAFLGRTLRSYQWTGMICVIAGLVIVGGADFIIAGEDNSGKDMNTVITGDLLIILAQIISATQMVLEERFLNKVKVHPLQVVGCEGVYGFVIMGILLCPMYYTYVSPAFSTNPYGRVEDVVDAFVQMGNSWEICLATVGNVFSIAFFNFAGVSVTKEISATTRTVLDSIRTLVVYVVSLGIGWETFQYLQIIGYVVLVCGMFIYNDLFIAPFMRKHNWLPSCCDPPPETTEEQPLAINNEEGVVEISTIAGMENLAADVGELTYEKS